MKFICYISYIFLLAFLFILSGSLIFSMKFSSRSKNKSNSKSRNRYMNSNKFSASLLSHLSKSFMFKTQANNLLGSLYKLSNYRTISNGKFGIFDDTDKELNDLYDLDDLNINIDSKNNTNSKGNSKGSSKNTYSKSSSSNSSTNTNTNSKNSYYQYYSYDQIANELKSLAKQNPKFLEVTTGQERYNLPNPGGECGNKKCFNYIAFLSDFNIDTKHKHQVNILYIKY